jgi:hypothetical protein
MAMDVLRSGRVDRAWIGSDNPTVAEIRWYKCSEGAKVFPTFHAFGSPVWEPDPDEWTQGPGVETEPVRWAPKDILAPPGQEYHGPLSWYQEGIPQTVFENPAPWEHELCKPKVFTFTSGIRIESYRSRSATSELIVTTRVEYSFLVP